MLEMKRIQGLTKMVVLYNRCENCHDYFKPTNKGMVFDPLCSKCIEKKKNAGKYTGIKCNLGHYTTFECITYPNRYEAYCKKCRCFIIQCKPRPQV